MQCLDNKLKMFYSLVHLVVFLYVKVKMVIHFLLSKITEFYYFFPFICAFFNRTTKGCMHMRICYSGGLYVLGEYSRPFLSVACMIKYFSRIPVPIRDAEHIKLGTPVLRCELLPSSSLSQEEHL